MTLSVDQVTLRDRPLLVCDVDDVVLQFTTPLSDFLESLGHRLLQRSYRLHGNVVSADDETPLEGALVSQLLERFFAEQHQWQTPFSDATKALAELSKAMDLVFLTAMPPAHAELRRQLLDAHQLHYPLISTEDAKGPIVAKLHANRPLPVVFIDDMVHNLHSVGDHLPESLLIYLPPDVEIHRHAPPHLPHVKRAGSWKHAQALIVEHLRQQEGQKA
ncbi:hypothetical protein FE840_011590 [Peteryoungia desertarenae]|uniref:Uncharacterized protein n=1 Tax=Peteryoungia desertarenae TaxID=1813451 RepID=A0ABX6QPE9_9HYPH|nr:hypothetical protein [Peteryoungia desertarenae]QLF70127.1 hypothetical protein FE840_011590 [Peteryoungia desertarenae]